MDRLVAPLLDQLTAWEHRGWLVQHHTLPGPRPTGSERLVDLATLLTGREVTITYTGGPGPPPAADYPELCEALRNGGLSGWLQEPVDWAPSSELGDLAGDLAETFAEGHDRGCGS